MALTLVGFVILLLFQNIVTLRIADRAVGFPVSLPPDSVSLPPDSPKPQ